MATSMATHSFDLDEFRSIPLLRDAEESDLRAFQAIAERRGVEAGQAIFQPDEPPTQLFFLVSGCVRLARSSPAGKQITLALLSPGAMFGEQGMGGAVSRGSVAEAFGPTVLCAVAASEFANFARRRPVMALRAARLAAERTAQIEELVADIVFLDARTRLARLLVVLSETHGMPATGGTLIDLPFTHQDLSHCISATRETTTGILNTFKRAGVLTLGRRRIVVADSNALGRLARPGTPTGRGVL